MTAGTLRADVAARWLRWRVALDVARHLAPPPPSSFARFGARSLLLPPARVNSPECIEIGDDVVALEHAWFSVRADRAASAVTDPPRLAVGDRVRFGRCVTIACIGEIVIEDDVLTSDNVFIADCFHDYSDPHTPVLRQPMSEPQRVRIASGAYLGADCVILQGVTVGAGAYVGEGAVVTKDVEPRTVVMGNPARVVERYP